MKKRETVTTLLCVIPLLFSFVAAYIHKIKSQLELELSLIARIESSLFVTDLIIAHL